MAKRPNAKSAGADRVTFTRDAAERIVKVVRAAERGNRDCTSLTFERPVSSSPAAVRMCTFTGTWSLNSFKHVTFKYQTNTPNTVLATNIFATITGVTVTSTTKNCAIAKEGTAWFLIASQC